MFGAWNSRRGGEIVAVADIGSASAAFALLRLREGAPAVILAAARGFLPIENRQPEAAIAAIGRELARTAQAVLKDFHAQNGDIRTISRVRALVRAPWTSSRTLRGGTKFEDERLIQGRAVPEIARALLAGGGVVAPERLLEAAAVRVELNGYPTGNPAGKRARSIGVSVLLSECDPALRQAAEAALEEALPHIPRAFGSATRAIMTVLSAESGGKEGERDCVVADISGEATNLFVLRAGVPAGHALVPEGSRTLLARLAPAALPEETISLLRMLERDQCSGEACENLARASARAASDLVRPFGEALAACDAPRRLPPRLILLVQPDFSGWFSQFFSKIDFTQFTETLQPFSVRTLDPGRLAPWVQPGGGAETDVPLLLDCALVNIEAGRAA